MYKAAKQKNYQIAWNFITGRNMLEVDEFIEDLTDSYDCKEIGFEKYDPYLNGMSTYFIKLGEDLEKYLGIEGTKPLEYCENSDINMPAKAQYWCYQNEDRMYNFHCEGKILFIKRDCLKQYLLNQPDKVMVTQMNVRYSDGYKLYGEKSEAAERRIIQIWDNQLTELMDEIIVHVDHC